MKPFQKFIIFCVIGGLSFFIDLAFVNLFFFLDIPFPIARAFSISLALVFNFFANRAITFRAHNHPVKKQILPYVAVYSVSNLVNLFSSILIVGLAGENIININLASFIGTAISIPISFFGSLLWTFKKR